MMICVSWRFENSSMGLKERMRALTRPLPNTLSRIQAIFWHFRIVDGKICTRERVLVSAPMGGDRVKHGYGGMVHEASRLGRCLEERGSCFTMTRPTMYVIICSARPIFCARERFFLLDPVYMYIGTAHTEC